MRHIISRAQATDRHRESGSPSQRFLLSAESSSDFPGLPPSHLRREIRLGPAACTWKPAPSSGTQREQPVAAPRLCGWRVHADGGSAGGSCGLLGLARCVRITPAPAPGIQSEAPPGYVRLWRRCQLCSRRARRRRTRKRDEGLGAAHNTRAHTLHCPNAAPARTKGFAPPAPLQRVSSHGAALGSAWKHLETV